MHNDVPVVKYVGIGSVVMFAILLIFSSFFTVQEGHVGILKRFGQATEQVTPGAHIKVPFIDKVDQIEVRTKRTTEVLASATAEQMPIQVTASVNWTVRVSESLDLYKKYGSLEQFEDRILNPKLRASVKRHIPGFNAEQLVQDRSIATTRAFDALVEELKEYPVTVDGLQIEDISLPKQYIQSIEVKQTEKNLAAAEQHKLARQALEAQRQVNTANAERDATKARADGAAYATRVEAEAEAHAMREKGSAEAAAIKEKAAALGQNPLLVELTKAQQWDGAQPQTVMGEGAGIIMSMGK